MRKSSEFDLLLINNTPESKKEEIRAELKKLLVANKDHLTIKLTDEQISKLSDVQLLDVSLNQLHGIEIIDDDETIHNGTIKKISQIQSEKESKKESKKEARK